jgi:hypothetical protein
MIKKSKYLYCLSFKRYHVCLKCFLLGKKLSERTIVAVVQISMQPKQDKGTSVSEHSPTALGHLQLVRQILICISVAPYKQNILYFVLLLFP